MTTAKAGRTTRSKAGQRSARARRAARGGGISLAPQYEGRRPDGIWIQPTRRDTYEVGTFGNWLGTTLTFDSLEKAAHAFQRLYTLRTNHNVLDPRFVCSAKFRKFQNSIQRKCVKAAR